MKICVIGAGAIGGLLAVKLHASGNDVTVVARGPHLAAIRTNGLTLIEDGVATVAPLKATDRIAEAGRQDLIILGMKAHQVEAVVDDLSGISSQDTMILTAQNGIPWWYFLKTAGAFAGRTLESVDPGGRIAARLPTDQVIGTVVYPAAEIVEAGVIKHIEGNRFSLAEIDNTETDRVRLLSETFRAAGFKAPVVSDIRAEMWTKLWGNLSFNPVSALTHSTLEELCRYPLTRALVTAMMQEAQAIGEALGIRFRVSIEKRLAGGEAVGPHKTSMLQDIEAGRAMEADALIGSVIELGRIVGLPSPHIDSVYALVKLLSKTVQDQKGRLKIEGF